MSNITLNFNSEIRRIFREKNISIHDGLTYLLSLYYGTSPSYIPETLERRVLACGIVNKNYESNEIEWRVPLFEEQEVGFEWIGEWMDLFKTVNPERRGTKKYVLSRMKKFFVNNPAIRKDDIFEATKLYLKGVSDPRYCKKSHKFIYEQDGSSMLNDYVENLKRRQESNFGYMDDVI